MIDRGWKFYPAVRMAAAFAAGIIVARYLAPSQAQLLLLIYCSLGWFLVGLRTRLGTAVPLHAALLLAGALIAMQRTGSSTEGVDGAAVRDAEVIGRVVGDPVFRSNRIELLIEPDSLLFRNSVAHPGGHLLLRLYDSTPFDPGLLPAYGDHVSIMGVASVPPEPLNPGEFAYGEYLRSRHIDLLFTAWRASSIHIFERDDLSAIERLVLAVRRAARDFGARYVGAAEGGIMRALLLGEREDIDPETREAFTRTGTVHVLAVSGFNVGLIALALFVVVSWMPNRWAQLLAFAPLLGLYVLVAGAEASLLRAAVMAIAFMLARVTSRISRPLNTLGVAALVILCFSPAQLFDIGFQLSFASVAGILMLYTPMERLLRERFGWVRRHAALRWTAQMLLLSFSAQLFTLPFVLFHFGYVSLISLAINLPVVPLTSMALGAGVAGSIAQTFSPLAASWFGGAAYAALAVAEWLVASGAALSLAGVEPGTLGIGGALLIAAGVLYLALARRPAQAAARAISFGILLAVVLLAERLTDPLRRNSPELYLLGSRDGVVAATAIDDTVTVFWRGGSRDSSFACAAGEALRRRLSAGWLRALRLDSADAARGEILLINDAPREYLLASLPVILSATAQRKLSVVRAFGERYLLVPLKGEPERALALAYDGEWREVAW